MGRWLLLVCLSMILGPILGGIRLGLLDGTLMLGLCDEVRERSWCFSMLRLVS